MQSQFTTDILNDIEDKKLYHIMLNIYTTQWDLAETSSENRLMSHVLMIYDLVSKFAWFRPLNF